MISRASSIHSIASIFVMGPRCNTLLMLSQIQYSYTIIPPKPYAIALADVGMRQIHYLGLHPMPYMHHRVLEPWQLSPRQPLRGPGGDASRPARAPAFACAQPAPPSCSAWSSLAYLLAETGYLVHIGERELHALGLAGHALPLHRLPESRGQFPKSLLGGNQALTQGIQRLRCPLGLGGGDLGFGSLGAFGLRHRHALARLGVGLHARHVPEPGSGEGLGDVGIHLLLRPDIAAALTLGRVAPVVQCETVLSQHLGHARRGH